MVERVMRVRCAIEPRPRASEEQDSVAGTSAAPKSAAGGSATPLEGSQPEPRARTAGSSRWPRRNQRKLTANQHGTRAQRVLPLVPVDGGPDAEQHQRRQAQSGHRKSDDERAGRIFWPSSSVIGTREDRGELPQSPVTMPRTPAATLHERADR